MKNLTKIVVGTLLGGAVTKIFCKICKDSVNEIKEEIRAEEAELRKFGIKPGADLDNLPTNNFVTNVLDTLLRKVEWEDEVLETVDYENHDQSLWGSIRVMQRTKDSVSVFIQIPPYLNGFKTLKQYKEDILEILKDYLGNNNVNRYKVKNIGYWLTISDEVTESGEREYITEEISENDCLEFSVNESYTDGLGRLVSHYYKNNCENLKKEQDLASVSMFVEINLPLAQDANDKFNMNVVKMVGLLKTLTYDLNIMERGDCADDVYPSIIFFPKLNSFDTYLRTIKNENGILNSYRAETLRTRE